MEIAKPLIDKPSRSEPSAREYRYRLLDVFTRKAFEGNQLAVFPDAEGLDDALMQKLAREFNLPETTFVFPDSSGACIAEVRIFTPLKEMIFAGHPTLGTGYVLIDEGRVPHLATEFSLREKVGPVSVRIAREQNDLLWLRTPEIRWGRTLSGAACSHALGLEARELLGPAPQVLNAGNPTLLVALRSPAAVDRAQLHSDGFQRLLQIENVLETFCVFVFAPTADGAYSRMFAPGYGIAEDPATGSSTGPLAAYMVQHGLASGRTGSTWTSEQGTKMGRRSTLYVLIRDVGIAGGIEVGGYVTPIGEGRIRIATVDG